MDSAYQFSAKIHNFSAKVISDNFGVFLALKCLAWHLHAIFIRAVCIFTVLVKWKYLLGLILLEISPSLTETFQRYVGRLRSGQLEFAQIRRIK